MNFEEALRYLLALGHETLAIKFGLENTRRLLRALGEPQHRAMKVQLAGTNGKGSTAVMLEAVCRAAGIRTGLYTSPHLVSILERIRLQGANISAEDFARLATRVRAEAERLVETGELQALPTFFEQVTAIALKAFQAAQVELVILETGLGGRLDATTAAAAEVVAITPIALDHQEYLGETISEIAFEKAAIIRPGVAAIIAPQPLEAMEVINMRCAECEVEPRLVCEEPEINGADERGRLSITFRTAQDVYERVRLNLPGRHQALNASVAIALAETLRGRGYEISRAAIIDGLESAQHPGRLEWREGKRAFLFDGAHNSAGALALRAYLDEFVKAPLTLVFGAMRDKDLDVMAGTLFPAAEHLVLTELANQRTATKETLRQLASHHAPARRVTVTESVAEALRAAAERTEAGGVICVTGSLYLIGEAQELLKHKEHESYAI
jgi:dihydrofolate synthase/folylpolyglutamate synthase